MSDLINRQAAIDAIRASASKYTGFMEMEMYTDDDAVKAIEAVPSASPWHRVEDDPPDGKEDAIFYYEWTGISGTVYKETSIISLNELMALGCRPIEWMEIPERREPPKEDA